MPGCVRLTAIQTHHSGAHIPMRALLSFVLSLAVLASLRGAAPPARNVCDVQDGYYTAEGTESDGSAYDTLVSIRRTRYAYLVKWHGDTTAIGVGFRDPDSDNLVVGWASPKSDATQMRGVVSYKVFKGQLYGLWTSVPGHGLLCTERLTYLRAFPKPKKSTQEDVKHVATPGSL